MSVLLKLPTDLALEVIVPILSTPSTRSAASLLEIGEAIAEQDRYKPRDVDGNGTIETMCNFAFREALKMLDVDIPRMLANDLHDFLLDMRGQARGFARVPTEWMARDLAQQGRPVAAIWKNLLLRQTTKGLVASPGHVGLLMPARPQDPRSVTWMMQAGAANFAHGTLTQGFGLRPVTFIACP